MGLSMCSHLIKSGYPISVYTRTLAKAEPLREMGVTICESVAQVAAQSGTLRAGRRNSKKKPFFSDVVITMVGFPSDVRQVVLGRDGILNNIRPGGLMIDMTTSEVLVVFNSGFCLIRIVSGYASVLFKTAFACQRN